MPQEQADHEEAMLPPEIPAAVGEYSFNKRAERTPVLASAGLPPSVQIAGDP